MIKQLKSILLTSTFILSAFSTFGQINLEDSTVQVIGFWGRNEKQNYSVSLEKINVKGSDTTSREMIKYDVEITIKDSTSDSYTIEWFYRNFTNNSENKIVQKMLSISQDMKVLIKTDELGVVKEVVNWEEVRDYIKKGTNLLRQEFKDIPKMEDVITLVENTYLSKAAIESQAILDAQQFYNFHGARYKLGEVLEGQLKSPNLYGSEPFDTDFTVYLDEINQEDNNYILRSTQSINSDQLAEATYAYLTRMANKMGTAGPKKEDLKNFTNETLTASRIHGSGWVVYSILTKTVTFDKTSNIEERIIEIK